MRRGRRRPSDQRDGPGIRRKNDPEVAAAATERPEQVGVLVLARAQDPAVGRHDVGREEVVEGKAVARHDPAEAAAERQPRDAGRRDDTAGDSKPVDLGLGSALSSSRPAVRARCCSADRRGSPSCATDRSSGRHRSGPAGHAVATTPYRQLQTFVTRGRDRRHDVGDALTLRDQRWALGDQRVVDLAGAVVVGVTGLRTRPAKSSSAGGTVRSSATAI